MNTIVQIVKARNERSGLITRIVIKINLLLLINVFHFKLRILIEIQFHENIERKRRAFPDRAR